MRKLSKKTLALVVSLSLLVCIGVGTTLAYLSDVTGDIKNIFTTSKVTTYVEENVTNGVKSGVKIENTGNTTAYIRAAVVVTWQTENGNVYGKKPVAGDYTLVFSTDDTDGKDGKWVKDGEFYYWTKPVEPGEYTGILITSGAPVEEKTPDGYGLCIEILGSGIQSVGTNGTKSAVEDAWGIDPSTLN